MKSSLILASLALVITSPLCLGDEQPKPVAPLSKLKADPVQAAVTMGNRLAYVLVEGVSKSQGVKGTTIASWSREMQLEIESKHGDADSTKWTSIDLEAKMLRNPKFWCAHFEVVPTDFLWSSLPVMLLISEGEFTRAQYLIRIAQKRIPAGPRFAKQHEFLTNFDNACKNALAQPISEVKDGIASFHSGRHDEALMKLDSALARVPRFGWALYEKGLILREKESGTTGFDPFDARYIAYFVKARTHDPLQANAYQADVSVTQTIAAAALKDNWAKFQDSPEFDVDQLKRIARGFLETNNPDMAIFAECQAVLAQKLYTPDSLELIGSALRSMPDAETTEYILYRFRNLAGYNFHQVFIEVQ